MQGNEHRRLANEFKRIRHLRTNNPFCRICGKALLWARYEHHHPDLRVNSPDTIFICEDCHRELHAMLNDFPRIPSNVPQSRHRLIHMARGQIAIARLSQKKWGDIEQWLLNTIDLPPTPEAENDNDPGGGEDQYSPSADMEALDKKFGDVGNGGSQ